MKDLNEFAQACKDAGACVGEYDNLIRAIRAGDTRRAWGVVLSHYSWCMDTNLLSSSKEVLEIISHADVDARNNFGNTTLMLAARCGHIDIVRELLAQGADANAKNDSGDTALMWAACYGHFDIVRELLAQGADANEKNVYGDTALMWAAREGHLNIVRELEMNNKTMTREREIKNIAQELGLDCNNVSAFLNTYGLTATITMVKFAAEAARVANR